MDRPQSLTPPAAAELASALACIAAGLEPWVPAVAALLKVQFSGLLYSYDPILSHVVLMLYCRFSDAFAGGDELGIARRSRPSPKNPTSRSCSASSRSTGSWARRSLPAHSACWRPEGKREEEESKRAQVVKLFEDGLVCVSAYKWLPPWSTETLVAFRALHKFLVGVSPHDADSCDSTFRLLMESTIFNTLKTMLVNLALEHRGLVPVIAYFIDRLLGCEAHQLAGELLLQTLDEHLLPKLEVGYQLSSYFPVFEKIAQNYTVPPHGLLELLTKQMVSLAEKHGPDTELKSWSQGSKVLGVCHVTIKHHHSSRIFLPLSRLLAFTCQFFPDLEVRDTARVYLRMLLCIPGKKLRHIMGSSEQPSGVSPSASLFQVPSPRPPQDLNKKLSSISSYIHLERVVPLLVQQSWLLALPNFNTQSNGSTSFVGIQDISSSPSLKSEKEINPAVENINAQKEPLLVMDSKVAGILTIYSCMGSVPAVSMEEANELPALYATTITFSSTSKYGKIPPCRVPFLLGEPSKSGLDIVPLDSNSSEGDSSYRALIVIELEPREPMAGIIDVASRQILKMGKFPHDIPEEDVCEYYLDLFHALWEACGNSASTGRETFPLSSGKGYAAINGTRSVKLLEIPANSLVNAVEKYLSPFVVSVIGDKLVRIVRQNGVIRDVFWEEEDSSDFAVSEGDALVLYSPETPLQLPYIQEETDSDNVSHTNKRNIGVFHVLIFLPPRFHLLFLMEVGEISTLVRIRTDHWPCLAYVDEYLEALL
uniref:Uncharacterized protein n=1 Tax=Ananas comosus var. bracteatus TaxID=296719 RepID=A0A6V7PHW4_ANACO|nr:unnamed protein product [Ananas comosus var. bracteatus]